MVQVSPPPARPGARIAWQRTDRMPYHPPADAPRCAVVDLGSNSVRLVVYQGHTRNPVSIFNEKAVLRLGRGQAATGRLNEDGMAQAFTVLHRYHAVARAMGADPFEILATAAVRDATNGHAFVDALQARLVGGVRGASQTTALGVIRLAEQSGNDPTRARAIADAELSAVDWLSEGMGRDLYLVGGAWRALARI